MFTSEKIPPMPVALGCGRVIAPSEHGNYGKVDPEAYEQQCALLEHNEQAAKRRAYENEYWRQRTLARQIQSRPNAQRDPDSKALAINTYPLGEMDPKHRVGEMLNIFMDEYNRLKPSQLFFDWVSSMTPTTQTSRIRKVMKDRGYEGTVKASWVRSFNRGIRYMNSGERSSYQIQINNGVLYQNGSKFDTGKMKTQFSGTGVAIFVQSIDGTFYSSNHLGGRLQQSGSASNAPCRSAGEWKVDNGRIEWISGESGFYIPTMKQLINAVSDLKFQNALDQATEAGVPTPLIQKHAQPKTAL